MFGFSFAVRIPTAKRETRERNRKYRDTYTEVQRAPPLLTLLNWDLRKTAQGVLEYHECSGIYFILSQLTLR